MARCAAELAVFFLCLRLSSRPGGESRVSAGVSAGLCRFTAETKTVLCSNMTSLRGLADSDISEGTHLGTGTLERIEIFNSQERILYILNMSNCM